MPQTTKTTHPLDSNLVLTFEEEPHTYTDNRGREYLSVTSLVKKHFPEFDEITTANRLAEREGVTAQSLLDKWHAKRDAACEYGTRVHEFAEWTLTCGQAGQCHTPRGDKEVAAFVAVRAACKTLRQIYELVACELVLFDPATRIAGTLDLLMLHAPSQTYFIIDWKTNEQLEDKIYNNGLGPCSDLPDSPLSKYKLQLSIYEDLLRSQGHIPNAATVQRAIVHAEPFNTTPKWIALPHMPHARAIIDERRDQTMGPTELFPNLQPNNAYTNEH
jgi:ATP-dependent exoDNAse (exonuclease V) beta subunit